MDFSQNIPQKTQSAFLEEENLTSGLGIGSSKGFANSMQFKIN